MEDLISVIIPVYNHSEHLQKVLDSLSRQIYQNLEVIVVDDGSDVPLQKERFVWNTSLSLRFFRQENKGAPAARNFGFRESQGEFVIFWDADVVGSPDMLEKLYKGLEDASDASYSYCDHYHGSKRIPTRNFDGRLLKENNYIPTMSLIRRKDFCGFDESLKRFQDWDLWLTLLEQGKHGVYVPGFLWRAYPHRGGMSTWLPSFAYRFPFKYFPFFYARVRAYERAKQIVQKKHHLR